MQNVGCRALCNFIDRQNRSTIVIPGGIKIIINTINRHSTHKDVQIQEYALEETLFSSMKQNYVHGLSHIPYLPIDMYIQSCEI